MVAVKSVNASVSCWFPLASISASAHCSADGRENPPQDYVAITWLEKRHNRTVPECLLSR